jgi:hypothetical protein
MKKTGKNMGLLDSVGRFMKGVQILEIETSAGATPTISIGLCKSKPIDLWIKTPGGGMGEIVRHGIHKNQPLHPKTGLENNHFFIFGAKTPKKKKPLLKQQSKNQHKQNGGGGKPSASLRLKLGTQPRSSPKSPIAIALFFFEFNFLLVWYLFNIVEFNLFIIHTCMYTQ